MDGAAEIVAEGVQRIGLKFGEGATEFLLDAVDRVKEIAAVHVQFAAAEFPVRAEQKVITENPVLLLVQGTAANEAKISHIFFRLPGVNAPGVASAAKLQ